MVYEGVTKTNVIRVVESIWAKDVIHKGPNEEFVNARMLLTVIEYKQFSLTTLQLQCTYTADLQANFNTIYSSDIP